MAVLARTHIKNNHISSSKGGTSKVAFLREGRYRAIIGRRKI